MAETPSVISEKCGQLLLFDFSENREGLSTACREVLYDGKTEVSIVTQSMLSSIEMSFNEDVGLNEFHSKTTSFCEAKKKDHVNLHSMLTVFSNILGSYSFTCYSKKDRSDEFAEPRRIESRKFVFTAVSSIMCVESRMMNTYAFGCLVIVYPPLYLFSN